MDNTEHHFGVIWLIILCITSYGSVCISKPVCRRFITNCFISEVTPIATLQSDVGLISGCFLSERNEIKRIHVTPIFPSSRSLNGITQCWTAFSLDAPDGNGIDSLPVQCIKTTHSNGVKILLSLYRNTLAQFSARWNSRELGFTGNRGRYSWE